MKRYYPGIILLISSYKFYAILRSYTNLLLRNQPLPELVHYLIPKFYNFIILISFITILVYGKLIQEDKACNTLFLKLSKNSSVKKYFFDIFTQNLLGQIYILFASLILPLFVLFFTRLDIRVLLTSFLGLFFIFILESLIFSFLSIFRFGKYLSIVLFLLLYNLFFPSNLEDYFYGIINIQTPIFILSLTVFSIFASKKLITWYLYEDK